MAAYKVIVTDDRYGSYDEENAVLKEVGVSVEVHDLGDEAQTIKVLKDADGILVNLHPLPAAVIKELEKCRVISRYGVGYDNVHVETATAKGIWVTRVPDYCLEDVSDQAVALLLGCVRKVAFKDRRIREGDWNLHRQQPSYRIAGRTLGLIGYGAIARTLHRKMSGFALSRVLVFDPYLDPKKIEENGAESVNLRTLLKESDYVSVHAPLNEETRGLIGARELSLMKPTAILVNTSRGPLLEEQAVAEALAKGKIAAAGLDVFESEPLPPHSPLLKLDNVILSDHAGWYSEESVAELKTKAAQNVLAVLKGGKPVYPVNHPLSS
ncbi:MAG: C-terminal binding protein [Spirochaetaceae bacterium]|nr:MAG: C-terminal binding protein [Spirochaetaceae bacterium]